MNSFIFKILLFVNILLYVVVAGIWISIPEELTLNISTSVFNIFFTMFLLISEREKLKKFYETGRFQYFTNTFISIVLIFSILGIINYLFFKNPLQFDFSRGKVNTLSSQSMNIARHLDDELKIIVFAKKGQFSSFQSLLELYRIENIKIEVELIDIDLRPELARSYFVDKVGTIILLYKGKKEKALGFNELQITNGIIKVTREKDPVFYFENGHGEKSLEDKSSQGLSHFKKLLLDSSFKTDYFNLLTDRDIPKTLENFVIWGPRSGFSKKEIAVVRDFLLRGGNLIISLDPDLNKDRFPRMRKLLSEFGIEIENNLVLDQIKHINGSKGTVPLIEKLNRKHLITSQLNTSVFFPLTSSVFYFETKIKGEWDALAKTSPFPGSWAEYTPSEFSGTVHYDEKDIKGPITVAGIWKGDRSNIFVLGNSTLIQNNYSHFSGNFRFLFNAFSWMTHEKRLISLDIPQLHDDPVFMSGSQIRIIFYCTVILLPLALFGMAIFIYRRRQFL